MQNQQAMQQQQQQQQPMSNGQQALGVEYVLKFYNLQTIKHEIGECPLSNIPLF